MRSRTSRLWTLWRNHLPVSCPVLVCETTLPRMTEGRVAYVVTEGYGLNEVRD